MFRTLHLALLLFISSLLTACGSGGGGGSGERSQERLRFVHAAPSLGMATILLDGAPIIRDIRYGNASPYIEIDETIGEKSIFTARINPEFALPTAPLEAKIDSPYRKTLLLTEEAGVPSLTLLDEPLIEPTSGESLLRFVNANGKEAAVDIYVTSPSTTLSGRTAVVSQLAFKGVSTAFPTEPGDYRIRVGVTAAGETAPTVLYDSKTYSIDADESYTFIFLEKRGGGKPYTALTIRRSEED